MTEGRRFIKCVWAEAVKQHHNYFHSKTIYISLFIWPFLSFLTAYYGYFSFDFGAIAVPFLTPDNLVVYLLLGFMCMSFFRSLVQSAWQFSFERRAGTLEYIYLSPASRLAVLLGNAVSSVFESVFVMVVFSALILFVKREVLRAQLVACLLVFVVMLVLAIGWGVLLNALFLYARDTGFLFTILEEPMEIFSGVKVPVSLFPAWGRAISVIFPLTYVLEAVRRVVLTHASLAELTGFFLCSGGIMVLLFGGAAVTIGVVERHMRKTGNVILF